MHAHIAIYWKYEFLKNIEVTLLHKNCAAHCRLMFQLAQTHVLTAIFVNFNAPIWYLKYALAGPLHFTAIFVLCAELWFSLSL